MNEQSLNPDASDVTDPNLLELRDIHLPDPVSWWPLAPGWWLTLATVMLIIAAIIIARKIYQGRQLRRDISAELELIKQQYQQTGNRTQLARSLSVLLRRANISYYQREKIAGLTGKHWLEHLDKTNTIRSAGISFQSGTGEVLLNAPYLPDDTEPDFDAQALIALCESWLMSTHTKTQVQLP